MAETGLHSALSLRVEALGRRIAALKTTMGDATDAKRIGALGELQALEQRHHHLGERLRQISHDGAGFRQDASAELSLLADSIQGGLDHIMFSIDAHYAADERTMAGHK
jgi:predicted  nucleic acid-binding Zn-ribbon protein